MRRNIRVTFAMRDLDRLKCIQAVVDGDLKLVRASERLGLTTRQVLSRVNQGGKRDNQDGKFFEGAFSESFGSDLSRLEAI